MKKRFLSLLLSCVMVLGMVPMLPSQAVAADRLVTTPTVLTTTGTGLVSDQLDATQLAKERSYTLDDLKALAGTAVSDTYDFSAINSSATRRIYTVEGLPLSTLLDSLGDSSLARPITAAASDGYSRTFDGSSSSRALLSDPRFFYPGIFAEDASSPVDAPPVIAWSGSVLDKNGGTSPLDKTPQLIVGQLNPTDVNNSSFVSMLNQIRVGNAVTQNVLTYTPASGTAQGFTRASLMGKDQATTSYTYGSSKGDKTDWVKGVPIKTFLAGVPDNYIVNFTALDGYAVAGDGLSKAELVSNNYMLAYEKGESPTSMQPVLEKAKSDASIVGYVTLYGDGVQPSKMVGTIKVTAPVAVTHTVTFNANGGTPVPTAQVVNDGAHAAAPAAMTKEGSTFVGWFKDAGLTQPWDFATDAVTTDITLYAKWDEATTGLVAKPTALVVTGVGVVGDGNSSALLSNQKAYTLDDLKALAGSDVDTDYTFSSLNDWGFRRMYTVKGIQVATLLAASGVTDVSSSFVKFVCDDGFAASFGVGQGLPSIFAERKVYPNALSGNASNPTVAPGAILTFSGSYSRDEDSDTIPVNANVPQLIFGQLDFFDTNNSVFASNVKEVSVGAPVQKTVLSITDNGGTPKTYKRADILALDQATAPYTYTTMSGDKTDWTKGVPISVLLKDVSDDAVINFTAADGYPIAASGMTKAQLVAGNYMLAYEKGTSATSLAAIYDTAKSDASISGQLALYGDGVQPAKMVNAISIAPDPASTATVTFMAHDGTPAPASQTVAIGGKVTQPAPMTLANYTFGGWYTDMTYTKKWDFATDTVAGNMTLHAKWDLVVLEVYDAASPTPGVPLKGFSLAELQAIASDEARSPQNFSAYNTFGTNKPYLNKEGPTLDGIVRKATGLGLTQSLADGKNISFSAFDGFTTSFSKIQITQERFYYPSAAGITEGSAPSAEQLAGAVPVVPMLAWTDNGRLCLGQLGPSEQVYAVFNQSMIRTSSSGSPGKITLNSAPTATITDSIVIKDNKTKFTPGETFDLASAATPGTMLSGSGTKVYYTLDGSTPTVHSSPMYNYNTNSSPSVNKAITAPTTPGNYPLRLLLYRYGAEDKIITLPFTVAAPDTTAPTVTAVAPAGTGAAVSGSIKITFSEPMDPATAGTVRLNALAPLTGGTWSSGNTVYTIPYKSLSNSTSYTVDISGFKDVAGNVMVPSATNTFTTAAAVAAAVPVDRLAGLGRIDTAIAIAKEAFPKGAGAVVLADATNFPDALAATPLATLVDAPILLTQSTALDAGTAAQIKALAPKTIYIVGGTGAVSDSIKNQLAKTYKVERLAGVNRYETSKAIADKVNSIQKAEGIFVVCGDNFADALSVSAIAGRRGMPIMLTPPTALDSGISSFVTKNAIKKAYIAGGTGAVTPSVSNQIAAKGATVKRWSGVDRYTTAAAVVNGAVATWNLDVPTLGVASGAEFPDGLTGGAAMGHQGGILVLSEPAKLSPYIQTFIKTHKPEITSVKVYGGTGALSAAVMNSLKAAVK